MLIQNCRSFVDLIERFPTVDSCIEFFEEERWHGNVVSPFDSSSRVYKCKNHRYRCKNTKKYFNVRTGTFLDSSNISLKKWLYAIWILTCHKKGTAASELSRDLGVTHKTAWFMAHRIRANMTQSEQEMLDGIVESDETFVGGKNKNRHKDKKVPKSQGRSFKDKTPVLGLLQRGGMLRTFVIPNTSGETIKPLIYKNVERGCRFISDEWKAYRRLWIHYDHKVIHHSKKQYVNLDDPTIHTNTIEGFWGIFKRGYNGNYNWMSRKHLQRYMDEFTFRYNVKNLTEGDKFCAFFSNFGNRLTYKQLIGKA